MTVAVEKGNDKKPIVAKGMNLTVNKKDSIEDVVGWLKDENRIRFNPDDLPDFSDGDLEKLPRELERDYMKARGVQIAKEKEANRKEFPSFEIEDDPIDRVVETKMTMKVKKGFHSYRARADELDELKEAGYQVDKVLVTKNGVPEMYACYIPEDVYQKHIQNMSTKSRANMKGAEVKYKEDSPSTENVKPYGNISDH
jgi:hypothetical protein